MRFTQVRKKKVDKLAIEGGIKRTIPKLRWINEVEEDLRENGEEP